MLTKSLGPGKGMEGRGDWCYLGVEVMSGVQKVELRGSEGEELHVGITLKT